MSAAVSSRLFANRELTFGFDPDLHQDNLVVYDVETKSKWSQLGRRAFSGAQSGTRLEMLPSIQTTWKHWRSLYPETTVVAPRGTRPLHFRYPPPILATSAAGFSAPNGLAPHQLVLGVVFEEAAKAYPFSELANSLDPVADHVGGREILIHYHQAAPAAWVTDREGNLLPGVTTLWSGWSRFHPNSEVFEQQAKNAKPRPAR